MFSFQYRVTLVSRILYNKTIVLEWKFPKFRIQLLKFNGNYYRELTWERTGRYTDSKRVDI